MIGVVVVGVIGWFLYALQPLSDGKNEEKEVMIATKASLGEISEVLEREGLIKSANALQFYALFSGSAHLIRPGWYRLQKGKSVIEIVERLVQGPTVVTVRIVEGATVKDIDASFGAAGVIVPGALTSARVEDFKREYPFLANVKTFEGFLYPDTYQSLLHVDASVVIRKMLDNFRVKALPLLLLKGSSLYRYLTIASMIEHELPPHEDERNIVAGIIEHRLALGMGLQIDATIAYAICDGAGQTCIDRKLQREDFLIDSPYNTYRYSGLPPTPISNPSANAIDAAVHSKKTAYLYYLSNPVTGRTLFSETFEEHDEKRAKYLR